MTFHTSCDFDFTYWPWDVQQCAIIIGSWTKTGDELDIINMNNKNVSEGGRLWGPSKEDMERCSARTSDNSWLAWTDSCDY